MQQQMQDDEGYRPQLVESGIAIRCDPFDDTSSIRPLVAKRRTANPFAKKVVPAGNAGSTAFENGQDGDKAAFTRSSILPGQRRRVPLLPGDSPRRIRGEVKAALDPPFQERIVEAGPSSERRADEKWRLLWRGALDVGQEGYRMEGELLISLPNPSSAGSDHIMMVGQA